MNIVKIGAKFLDQPLLVKKFSNSVPYILSGAGALFTVNETLIAPKGKKRKTAIKTGTIMGATVASALAAPKIAAKIFRNSNEVTKSFVELQRENIELTEKFLKDVTLPEKVINILEQYTRTKYRFLTCLIQFHIGKIVVIQNFEYFS